MNRVVVTIGGASSAAVTVAGVAMADMLHAALRAVDPSAGLDTREGMDAVLHELGSPDVIVAVLADGAELEKAAGYVISTCPKPVVVVPPRLEGRRPWAISRVLLPLDGTWEAAAAVAPTAELLAGAGIHLVVLHVFNDATVPRFWDQASHARDAWEAEFLARYCPHAGVRLELRTGAPGEHVLAVATDEGVDLIALGWSQHLNTHRARTVRQTVTEAGVPVMLVPVPDPPAGGDDSRAAVAGRRGTRKISK